MFQLLTTLNYSIKSIQLLNGTTDETVKYRKVQILFFQNFLTLSTVLFRIIKNLFLFTELKCFML